MDKNVIIYAPKSLDFDDPSVNPICIKNDIVHHQVPGGEHQIHADYGLRIFSALRKHKSRARDHICPRAFRFYGLSHLIEGKGWYWNNYNKLEIFESGRAVISSPGFIQDYAGYKTDYVQDAACFHGPVADQLFRAGIIQDGVFEIGNTRSLLPIIEQIDDPSFLSQIKANIMLQDLLVDIYIERIEAIPKRKYPQIDKLIMIIRTKPEKGWTVAEMAEICNMSISQFRRGFQEKTGHSPKKYIDMIKIQCASELLCGAKLSVGDVAIRIGFSDLFHFSRRFKQIIGMSPLNYRRQFS